MPGHRVTEIRGYKYCARIEVNNAEKQEKQIIGPTRCHINQSKADVR